MDRLYLPTINIHKKVKKFHIIFIVILKSKDYNLWKQLRKGDYNDERLWTFFEKYFGIGGSSSFNEPEHKAVTYDLSD